MNEKNLSLDQALKITLYFFMVTRIVPLEVQIAMFEVIEKCIKGDLNTEDILLLNNEEKFQVALKIEEFIHNFLNQISTKKENPYLMENMGKWIFRATAS